MVRAPVQGPCWADLVDSDPDDSKDGASLLPGLAAVPEDLSYQGLALASVEDSKDGLNAFFGGAALRLGAAAAAAADGKEHWLGSGGAPEKKQAEKRSPRDFGFLIEEEMMEREREREEAEAEAEAERRGMEGEELLSSSPAASRAGKKRNLNPEAPCFIPTCNPDLEPVAVLVTPSPEPQFMMGPLPTTPQSLMPTGRGTARPPARPLRAHASGPKHSPPTKRDRKGNQALGTPGSAGEDGIDLISGGPERKRSRGPGSDEGKKPMVRQRIHTKQKGGGSSSSILDSSSETTSVGTGLAPGEIPECTEEEWQHRAEMRMKHVQGGKALPQYKLYLEGIPRDARSPEDPMTPNHEDRTVSKRIWKENVIAWRKQVMERAKALGFQAGASQPQAAEKKSVASEELMLSDMGSVELTLGAL